ncbi:MAG: SpoIID/LytB domain-containing protein [Chitinophagales bacterium]
MGSKKAYWIIGAVALLLIAVVAALPQLRSPVRKPTVPQKISTPSQVSLSPEVKKYKEEPVITLYRHKNNSVQRIPLEKYLMGVVAAEIGTNQPTEALKAQAIAARSLVMSRIAYLGGAKMHKTNACDLPEHFQAYDETKVTDAIRNAVNATRGQVITYNGKFAYALFHSYSWKKTASIEEYFPEQRKLAGGYIKSVSSPGEEYAPAKERHWRVSIPHSELQSIFGPKADLNAIKITKRGPSGRALDISAGSKTVKAYDLRTRLGGERLKSTMITKITSNGNNTIFEGYGWGHGCGLSQWGAYAMAKQGRNSLAIVTHYYSGTRVVKLWK